MPAYFAFSDSGRSELQSVNLSSQNASSATCGADFDGEYKCTLMVHPSRCCVNAKITSKYRAKLYFAVSLYIDFKRYFQWEFR